MNIYKTKRWKRKRVTILKRDEYLCRESSRFGKTVAATTVHHIYPIDQYPELAFEDANLLSLSSSKHDSMHDRITGDVTELGKYWQDKVAPHLREKGYSV